LLTFFLSDTYAEAQKKLASSIAGEVVVSTDLENRGKGGRNKAKKRTADAATASSTSSDPSTSSKKRTRKDAGNEKEESRSRSDEGEDDISLQEEHVDFDDLSSSDNENTSQVSVPQTVPTLPVSTAPSKRSVKQKGTKKSSADKQLQLPSVPIGLGQKQVSSEIPHRQSTTVSIPPATGIHAIFTSIRLLLRLFEIHQLISRSFW
jgi:hypothetical protein